MDIGRRIAIVVLFTVVFGGGKPAPGSTAYLTSARSDAGNAFTTGVVNIASSPASAIFSVSGLYPGQSTSAVTVTVTNGGNLDLFYTLSTSVASGNTSLASTATLSITQGTCPGSTVLYSGALSSASLAQRPSSAIGPNGTDTLCFQATLPSTAASSLQGQTATVTFTFGGLQGAQGA